MDNREGWHFAPSAGSGTHGQWQVYGERSGDSVAVTYKDKDGTKARLISQAPRMIDALRAMVDVFNQKEIDPLQAFAAIEQAKHIINEATGEQHETATR
jgi:hypothetical protein